jgi:FkbM family methyltransferase
MSKPSRNIKQYLRDLLYDTPVFLPVRASYQRLFDRRRLALRAKMHDLYGPYIRRGDLVFDVGAHMGAYAEIFVELGAKVVAVEPNPMCCERLRRMARARDIQVENCAAGDVPGKLDLHICDENPSISTVADEWYTAAQQSPAHRDNKWLGTIEVRVVTLDQLAAKHGVPELVKIDAEGFDDHVLRGMSFSPRAVSFEFNLEIPQVAQRCLTAPIFASGYEFNYVRGMEMQLAGEHWMGPAELQERLHSLVGEFLYGDVLARQIKSR